MRSIFIQILWMVYLLLILSTDLTDAVRYVRYIRYTRYTRYYYTYRYTGYSYGYVTSYSRSGSIAGAIVGGVIALFGIIALIVSCCIFCKRRRTSSGRLITPAVYNANTVAMTATPTSGMVATVGVSNDKNPTVDGTAAPPGGTLYPTVAPPSYDASMAAQPGTAPYPGPTAPASGFNS